MTEYSLASLLDYQESTFPSFIVLGWDTFPSKAPPGTGTPFGLLLHVMDKFNQVLVTILPLHFMYWYRSTVT
jgi:hypothetical protein